MFCPDCGAPIPEDSLYCIHCGTKVEREAPDDIPSEPQRQDTLQSTVFPSAEAHSAPHDDPFDTPPAPMRERTYYAPPPAQSPAPPAPEQNARPSNPVAIVGFILAFVVPIAGLICSIIGYKRAKDLGAEHIGLAKAGIIIAAVNIGVSIISEIIFSIVGNILGYTAGLSFLAWIFSML